VLPRQLAQIVTLAERGIVDKGRIDALLSMGRILERSEALGEERAADKQKRSDDELAAMLERIDERIIELAQAYAERLGGSEHPEGTG
jgi:anti-sigma-K factor RskA